jgi:hypothetical protein
MITRLYAAASANCFSGTILITGARARVMAALASLHSIIRNRDSTVTPAFSNSIICCRVSPACSPATANLKTLAVMHDAAIPHLVVKGYVAREQSSVMCITNESGARQTAKLQLAFSWREPRLSLVTHGHKCNHLWVLNHDCTFVWTLGNESFVLSYGLDSCKSTTSESVWPRRMPSFFPSGDQ